MSQRGGVIIAHPGKQHSLKCADAIYMGGRLLRYYTTAYDKKGTITHAIKRLLSRRNQVKAAGRHSEILPDSVVQNCGELLGLLSLAADRLPIAGFHQRNFRGLISNCFQSLVAKEIAHSPAELLIMYDTNAGTAFSLLNQRRDNLIRVLDMSAAAFPYVAEHLLEEARKVQDPFFTKDCAYLKNARLVNARKRELALSHYFLAASSFTQKTLNASGIPNERIRVVPYGIDSDRATPKQYELSPTLRLIYVGSVSYLKGVHYLLSAIHDMSGVRLSLYGQYSKQSRIYQEGIRQKNIRFFGHVLPEELDCAYAANDVFVFPTLMDGFGQVILEAMSLGLPVIVSDHCAGPDIVQNGQNGFVVPAGNVKELTEKIEYFRNYPEKIQEMGMRARERAQEFSMERYRRGIQTAIEEFLDLGAPLSAPMKGERA